MKFSTFESLLFRGTYICLRELARKALLQTLACVFALCRLQMCLILCGLISFVVAVIHVYLRLGLLLEKFVSIFQVLIDQYSLPH